MAVGCKPLRSLLDLARFSYDAEHVIFSSLFLLKSVLETDKLSLLFLKLFNALFNVEHSHSTVLALVHLPVWVVFVEATMSHRAVLD